MHEEIKELNPSIADHVNIGPIAVEEKVEITITATDEDYVWPERITLRVWNSVAKNQLILEQPLMAEGLVLSLILERGTFHPKEYYYEIWDDTNSRIEYKGSLSIRP